MNLAHASKFIKSAAFLGASVLIPALCQLSAKTRAQANPASPAVSLTMIVRVYSFQALSAWLLSSAEKEAARMLRDSQIKLDWVNCTAKMHPSACFSPELPNELVVRIIPEALPAVTRTTLGVASRHENAGALIFYDRVTALRSPTRPLLSILGRVMAHEITHLLTAGEPHSDLGLMRAAWDADDLDIGSFACRGLSANSIRLMQNEVARRNVRINAGIRIPER
jgi:hypothetical protein